MWFPNIAIDFVFVLDMAIVCNLFSDVAIKIGIFNTNVKSVLLYACEAWKTTNQITRKGGIARGEFRPRHTRQLPSAVDLKWRFLSCQSY